MSTSKKAAPREPKPERFIVLLRHGIAEERSDEKKDEERSLTAEGHAKMKQIARGLERVLPKVQAIYSSPLLRAVQTALWVAKGYRSRVEVKTTEALAPGASRKEFKSLIEAIDQKRVIVVGHEPNLTESLAALTGIDAKKLELKKGGAYGVLLHGDGTAELEWVLTPKVLRKLAE
jgi:phosphohistidine phosphatase